MSERPFLGAEQMPDDVALRAALGPAFASYRQLADLWDGFSQEWVHTKSSGWMLKVFDAKKALCYVIPLQDSFRVSMAIREAERAELLEAEHMADYWHLVSSARKYAEGYSVALMLQGIPPLPTAGDSSAGSFGRAADVIAKRVSLSRPTLSVVSSECTGAVTRGALGRDRVC